MQKFCISSLFYFISGSTSPNYTEKSDEKHSTQQNILSVNELIVTNIIANLIYALIRLLLGKFYNLV